MDERLWIDLQIPEYNIIEEEAAEEENRGVLVLPLLDEEGVKNTY